MAKHRFQKLFVPLLFFWFLMATGCSYAEGVLVTHPGSSVASLGAEEVKDMFLGKKTDLGGQKIILLVLKGSEASDPFFKQYLNKTASQFMNFWKQQVFSGNGKLPKTLDTESDLVSFVSSNPGSLACVSSETYEANKDKVKQIAIN